MRFAFLSDDKVVSIQEFDTEEEAAFAARPYSAVINITDTLPQPQFGWVLVSGSLIDPTGVAQEIKHISKEKFLSRFTDNEICAIEDFSKGTSDPAKAIRAALKRQEQAMFIDLNYEKTRQGVQVLELLGLIAPGRANTILNTPLTAEERYRG